LPRCAARIDSRSPQQKFAHSPDEQANLREELKNLLAKEIPLEDLVPQLTTETQKEEALMLSYEVISSNQINCRGGSAVYHKLVDLLGLPSLEAREPCSRLRSGLQASLQNLAVIHNLSA
jgi:hypothetical protein